MGNLPVDATSRGQTSQPPTSGWDFHLPPCGISSTTTSPLTRTFSPTSSASNRVLPTRRRWRSPARSPRNKGRSGRKPFVAATKQCALANFFEFQRARAFNSPGDALCGVWNRCVERAPAGPLAHLGQTNANARSSGEDRAFGCRALAMTYFLTGNPQYHRRDVVSRSCSGWEGVGPTRYGRQANCWVRRLESTPLPHSWAYGFNNLEE